MKKTLAGIAMLGAAIIANDSPTMGNRFGSRLRGRGQRRPRGMTDLGGSEKRGQYVITPSKGHSSMKSAGSGHAMRAFVKSYQNLALRFANGEEIPKWKISTAKKNYHRLVRGGISESKLRSIADKILKLVSDKSTEDTGMWFEK